MPTWTTPRTWVDHEFVSAALLNAHVRDNLSYLYELGVYKAMNGSLAAPAATLAITGWQTADTAYSTLQIIAAYVRSDLAATYADNLLVRFNADATAANYSTAYLGGAGDATSSGDLVGSVTGISLVSCLAAVTADANCFGYAIITILQPASTTLWKTISFMGGIVNTTANEYSVMQGNGVWKSTAAITSITLLPNGGANLLAGLVWNMYGHL